MRVEIQSEEDFLVYINNEYFKSLDWDDKEEIAKNVKRLVLKLNKIYNLELSGFYKMEIYINKKVGMMIEIKKIEDFGINIKTIDLKIVIYLNNIFFVGVTDLDLIKKYSPIYLYDNKYYTNVENLSNKDLINIIEWGEFIYGDDVEIIKKRSRKINLSTPFIK